MAAWVCIEFFFLDFRSGGMSLTCNGILFHILGVWLEKACFLHGWTGHAIGTKLARSKAHEWLQPE